MASTIAELYKHRCKIEIFFKWIKQKLKIKSFLVTSENAIITQIWVAMIYYLLLAFIKFQTKYSYSMHDLARVVGEMLMEHVDIIEILRMEFDKLKLLKPKQYQMALYLKFNRIVLTNTIKIYRLRILEKMRMKNNVELTRYVVENGLVDKKSSPVFAPTHVKNVAFNFFRFSLSFICNPKDYSDPPKGYI